MYSTYLKFVFTQFKKSNQVGDAPVVQTGNKLTSPVTKAGWTLQIIIIGSLILPSLIFLCEVLENPCLFQLPKDPVKPKG